MKGITRIIRPELRCIGYCIDVENVDSKNKNVRYKHVFMKERPFKKRVFMKKIKRTLKNVEEITLLKN